jgi:hypothetical protein
LQGIFNSSSDFDSLTPGADKFIRE